jgi:hypothetical protein
MATLGGFTEEALALFQLALVEQYYEFSEDGEATFDFTRCQRANGTFYGTSGKCRSGDQVGAKEVPAPKKPAKASNAPKPGKLGGAKVGTEKRLMGLSMAQLKQLREDPRLYDYQKKKIDDIIAKKGASSSAPKPSAKPETPAAKAARPVDPKVAAKVDKAMDAKAKGPQYTPEQKAAQDEWLKKQMEKDPELKARVEKLEAKAKRKEERDKFRKIVAEDATNLANKNHFKRDTPEDTLAALKQGYRTMKAVFKDPAFQTPENRARMINMRLAIYKAERDLRNANVGGKIDPGTYKKEVANSPKYSKTPGSSSAIKKAKAEDVPILEAELKRLSAKLDEKGISNESALKVSQEMLEVNRRLMAARGDAKPQSPSLKQIYEEQGFNAKPELVGTASDLRRRNDIITNPDGSPIIIYRGVTTQEYANQFKGVGPDGDQHFPGRGIFGNGSYAATGAYHDPLATTVTARTTAIAYAGERKELATKVTAFALRKDANVFIAKGGSYNERTREYDNWYDSTLAEAERRTGYRFTDIGEAAAAVGIHAYQVPQRNEDYWVVLNRGAVIAAMDSELSD